MKTNTFVQGLIFYFMFLQVRKILNSGGSRRSKTFEEERKKEIEDIRS